MRGSLAFVLHAHLPFVRHPEHRRSLEETWLYEAITESYVPLLQMLTRWEAQNLPGQIALSLTPTLGAMLEDSLLRERYREHLERLIRLADAEVHRTLWEPPFQRVAEFYLERLLSVAAFYDACGGNLVGAFRNLQECGRIEILASAATHAVLPLLRSDPASLRAQVLVGRDAYVRMFGVQPRGFWLPECAWAREIEPLLAEAGLRWFVTESHGFLHAEPQPRYGLFAPVLTPRKIAAFGRDHQSARQVWSREEGYPGDPWYRDFYRDAGFDLDLDYVQEYLPVKGRRAFTGIKYHRITGAGVGKQVYDRQKALERANEHARHFVECRTAQFNRLEPLMEHPIIVCPYDAELFGHWWFEGLEFLDQVARKAHAGGIQLTTPGVYLDRWPRHQVAMPSDSSWGEQGYWRVWLNEKNHWIIGRLGFAQTRMGTLAAKEQGMDPLSRRALRQAGRELLLAQSSDWPFIIRTGSSPDYATRRVQAHLMRYWKLCDQIEAGAPNSQWLEELESMDNLFGDLECGYWR